MSNLFAAPPVSACKHYSMVTPTELGKAPKSNGLSVSHPPEKPLFAYRDQRKCLTAQGTLTGWPRRNGSVHEWPGGEAMRPDSRWYRKGIS
jgi:hypothetical protein